MPTGLGDEKLWLCPSLDDSADDISGNGNHGTYYGGMGTVADTSNGGTKAYSFDGSNTQRIECDPQVIGSEPVFSVSCWVYVNQHDASYGEGFVSQFAAGNNSATCKFSLGDPGGSSLITPAGWIRPSTSNIVATSSQSFAAQTWHHLCFIADGSNIFTYLDGVLRGTNTYSGTVRTVTNPFVIGTYNQSINQNHYLNGMVDDVRAFDRALTPTEITHLATSRGIAGNPYDYNGLGDEKLWLCPSLDDSADDISGNGNHGTYNGGMGTVADTSNAGVRAYSFDGSNDYIDLQNVLTGTSDFTISAWFKTDSLSYSYIYGKDLQFGASDGIGIAQSGGGVYGAIGSGSSRLTLTNHGSTVTTSSWHHLAITFDRDGNAEKFLDGVSVGTDSISSVSGNIGTDPDYVGRRGGSGGYFNGLIDDVRAFERALTTSEITALASKRGYEVPPLPTPHPLTISLKHPLG